MPKQFQWTTALMTLHMNLPFNQIVKQSIECIQWTQCYDKHTPKMNYDLWEKTQKSCDLALIMEESNWKQEKRKKI